VCCSQSKACKDCFLRCWTGTSVFLNAKFFHSDTSTRRRISLIPAHTMGLTSASQETSPPRCSSQKFHKFLEMVILSPSARLWAKVMNGGVGNLCPSSRDPTTPPIVDVMEQQTIRYYVASSEDAVVNVGILFPIDTRAFWSRLSRKYTPRR